MEQFVSEVRSDVPVLTWARRLVMAAILMPAVLFSLMVLDGIFRSARQDRTAIHWMGVLDLDLPAFRPSGTPERRPAALPPGFDLRISPFAGSPGRSYEPKGISP
jgi:hypothetical protein